MQEKLAKYLGDDATDSGVASLSVSKRINQELFKHHIIRISNLNNMKLFLGNLIPECCWKKK